jgi:transcriptional regulator with XRE-family HTH domain
VEIARTESDSQFGLMLRELRSRAGLTQEALAERAKLGVRTVRRLETGDRGDPRVTTVGRLADALQLDTADRVALLAAAGHTKPDEPRADPLADAVSRLAYAVRTRWREEEEQRKIQDPLPLGVRWQPVGEELTDSWANIRRVPGKDTDAKPLDLAGQLDQIVAVYRRIPSGRLVVLGQAGSGKTILTLRFVLDLLQARNTTDPVPVIFSLGSWQPATTNFRDWLIEQLIRDHPDLAAPGPDGATLAAALVQNDRVLPVLDGFDEIAAGLHRSALEALNATTLPLLLTSRADEYADAVAGTDVLTAAAGVWLTDLTPADVAAYLPRTTSRAKVWDPVLAELRDHPDANLAAVLATPLMVVLARTIYSDTPDHDPAELVDTERFPTRESLEEHLLGNFIPTVYRNRADLHHVQRWHGYLAHHLTRLGTHDLAWWQLGAAMRRPARMLVVGCAVAVVMGLADLLVEGVLLWQVNAFMVVFAAVLGLMAGSAFGLGYGLVTRRAAVEPSRVRMRVRGRAPVRARQRFGIGFAGGFLLGLGYGLVLELLRGLMLDTGRGVLVGVTNAVVFGVIFGLGAAVMFWLITVFEAPLDVKSAASPDGLLRANRTTVLTQLLMFAPTLALVVPLTGWLVVQGLQALPAEAVFGMTFSWPPVFGLAVALISGIGGGLGYLLSLTAWGHWLLFARLWLPLTGRLPWDVREFLDDAYARGVLRRAGAVYQFRHARLEDHLSRAFR